MKKKLTSVTSLMQINRGLPALMARREFKFHGQCPSRFQRWTVLQVVHDPLYTMSPVADDHGLLEEVKVSCDRRQLGEGDDMERRDGAGVSELWKEIRWAVVGGVLTKWNSCSL